MAQHPSDGPTVHNPRIQCVVCGKWKRLLTNEPTPPHDSHQQFFGGCSYNAGGDHLAKKGNDNDVCELCCHIACKALAEQAQPPAEAGEAKQ